MLPDWWKNSDKWIKDRWNASDDWVKKQATNAATGFIKSGQRYYKDQGKEQKPKPVIGTQLNSPYVMKNAAQLANEAAGRKANDPGESGQLPMGFEDFLALFNAGGGASGGGGGGGGSNAAYVAKLVNDINSSYDRRQQDLGTNRMSSLAQITGLADQYKQNLGGINQSYLQGIAAQNNEIARRAAEQQAMAQRTAQQLAGSLTGEGISAQPIQGQAENIVNTLATTNQFQRDLQDRMSQLAASSQAGSLASGELVRQGAAGTLENNYSAMLSALQNARAQEIMQAQAMPMGGSGGGGGGRSSGGGDVLDQMTKYLKGKQLFDEVMGGGTNLDINSLIGAAAQKDPGSLVNLWASLDPEQRKQLGL
jgi:hypothetical protein